MFVTRYDGHMALANSAALGRAGITERTPDPPGGAIVRDAQRLSDRHPQGRRDGLVTRVIPKMTPEQRLHAVKRALEHAASLGVTSVQDMNPSYDDIAVYADLANRGELTARIYAAPMETGWYDQAKLGHPPGVRVAVAAPRRREGLRRRIARLDDRVFLRAVHRRARDARPALRRDAGRRARCARG